MKKKIECPFCDGQAVLNRSTRTLLYRKESFDVVEHFYKCENCSEEFTTTETDTIGMLQLHNQYRERFKIPFTEEIIAIRERYELSATKMSEVLGLGINGYSNYEKGEIPTQAIGNLIKVASKPEVFQQMCVDARECFSKAMYDNTLKRVKYLIEKGIECLTNKFKINLYLEPVSLTGFKTPSVEKMSTIIVEFIRHCKDTFNDKLKINKLLFYTDFYCYKMTGNSMTGLTYRAIQYGPVPTNYDQLFLYLESNNIIHSNWVKGPDGIARETFIADSNFNCISLTTNEQLIIDHVCNKFKDTNSWDLVDLSHKETAWIETESGKHVIDYQKYAFDLQGL